MLLPIPTHLHIARFNPRPQNLQHMVLQYKARLVVVDSIAALARTEYGNPSGGAAGGSGLVGSIMDRQQVGLGPLRLSGCCMG